MLIILKNVKHIIGIDEVGRGCGAGPLMACAFTFLEDCKDVHPKDSKELSAVQRENIFSQLKELRKNKKVEWSLISVSPEAIDKNGIQQGNINAIRLSALNLVQTLLQNGSSNFEIIADGNLHIRPIEILGRTYSLNSVIKADKSYPAVSAASIIAKVIRDKYMELLHEKFPQYSWQNNKGYLTSDHCMAISRFGISPHHRKTFCKNLKEKNGSERCRTHGEPADGNNH